MVTNHIEISTPASFSFWPTVYSHGWCVLLPFSADRENRILSRLLELDSGELVHCRMSQGISSIAVDVQSRKPLSSGVRREVTAQLRMCLRVDEGYSDFYDEARRRPEYRWIPKTGAGRLLRAPSVFEDVVKMICTTNCSWALTKIMVGNLTGQFGREFSNGCSSFPNAGAIADSSEAFLRQNIRSGYRSPYLLELANKVAAGKLDLESWRSSTLPTDELFRQVKEVKGLGDYAAGNLLRLLGRYDYLGLDSWVRRRFYELHTRKRRVGDVYIGKHYAPLGKWRGLFFWLEMTKHRYDTTAPY